MMMGYNTDIDHHGITVHTQTEDHGLGDKKITTQVFFSGRILDSRTISYAEAISTLSEDEDRDNEIKKRMRAIHKHYLNRIRAGEYDAKLPIEGATPAPAPAPESESAPAPAEAAVKPVVAPPPKDFSLTSEIDAIEAEDLATDALFETYIENPGLDDQDIDFEMLMNQEERTWRGHDNDFNADLGKVLRDALGV